MASQGALWKGRWRHGVHLGRVAGRHGAKEKEFVQGGGNGVQFVALTKKFQEGTVLQSGAAE